MRFLLTIIVPTRNRQEYAYNCIEHILGIESERLQLVVRDNSDDHSLQSMLTKFSDDVRLKYVYIPGRVSFVSNFSEALAMAEGDYICFIGDDDGINPEIIAFTQWMEGNNIDAAKPELLTFYRWPLMKGRNFSSDEGGYMTIETFTGAIRTIDTKEQVQKYFGNGCGNYLAYDLAKPYHGITKREVFERIKFKTGCYFGGLTPDIYGAIALSLQNIRTVAVDYPLTIPGECPRSGSSDSRYGNHTGKLGDAPHFWGHQSYTWDSLVPKFYSVETIWSESAVQALTDLGGTSDQFCINYGKLYISLLKKYPRFGTEIMRSFFYGAGREHGIRFAIRTIYGAILAVQWHVRRRLQRLIHCTKVESSRYTYSSVPDIGAASRMLTAYLESQNLSLADVIQGVYYNSVGNMDYGQSRSA